LSKVTNDGAIATRETFHPTGIKLIKIYKECKKYVDDSGRPIGPRLLKEASQWENPHEDSEGDSSATEGQLDSD